jgi:hypothetical protein
MIPVDLVWRDLADPSFRANQAMNHPFEVIALVDEALKMLISYDHCLKSRLP